MAHNNEATSSVKQTQKNAHKGIVKEGRPGPGRPKGTPNKVTQNLREIIRDALEEVGGVDYLVSLARTDPKTFVPLLAKIIPQQHESGPNGFEVKHVIELQGVPANAFKSDS